MEGFFFYCLALSVFENNRSKQQSSLNYYRKQSLFRGYRGVKSDFLLFEVISVRHSNVCSRRGRQCRISQAGRTQVGGASRGSSLREHNKIQLLADRREKLLCFVSRCDPSPLSGSDLDCPQAKMLLDVTLCQSK